MYPSLIYVVTEAETNSDCLTQFLQFTFTGHIDSLIELANKLKMKFLNEIKQLEKNEVGIMEKKKLWMTTSTKFFGNKTNGEKAVNELELQHFPLLDILSSSVKTLKKENTKYNSKDIEEVIKRLEETMRELKPY